MPDQREFFGIQGLQVPQSVCDRSKESVSYVSDPFGDPVECEEPVAPSMRRTSYAQVDENGNDDLCRLVYIGPYWDITLVGMACCYYYCYFGRS